MFSRISKFLLLSVLLMPTLSYATGSVTSASIITPLLSPTVTSVTRPAFELIEFGLTLDAITTTAVGNGTGTLNPYDPAHINIWAELSDASTGRVEKIVYGFYMREYITNSDGQAILLSSSQLNNWRLRFVVEEAKHYKLKIFYCINAPDIAQFGTIYDVYGTAPSRHGYLRFPKGHNYMQFTDGTPFFAVGETLSPYDEQAANATGYPTDITPPNPPNPFPPYPTNTVKGINAIVNQFSGVGGNFLKYYFAPNSIDIEWNALSNYNTYQNRAHDMDKIVANMETKNVFMQLGLWTWEQFNTTHTNAGYDWNSHPYKNIPDVSDPVDVFISSGSCTLTSSALYYLKNKIRYSIARWGYSPNVASIELMTEIDRILAVDNIKEYWNNPPTSCHNNEVIDQAMIELATYVKSLSNRMLVTSGVANYFGSGGDFFRDPICDYADYHGYSSDYVNGGASHSYTSEQEKTDYKKPFHAGECGSGNNNCWYGSIPDNSNNEFDNQTQFSNPLWSTAFSGAFGNAMYFGIYGVIHNFSGWTGTAYDKFSPFSIFFNGENLNDDNYVSIRNKAIGWAPLDCGSNYATPECQLDNTIIPDRTLPYKDDHYHSIQDEINGYKAGTFAGIVTSNDKDIEVYALRSAKRAIGWVHNKSNYFYNLPHKAQPGSSDLVYYMHPNASGVLPGSEQKTSYVQDVTGDLSMTIKGLDCDGTYKIEWYSTRGAGGIIPALTQTNLAPVNGQLTAIIPPLKAITSSTPTYLPDYGFKITMTSGNGTASSSEWKTKYVNEQSQSINGKTGLGITNNNRMYYLGDDDQLHCYYYDEHCWEESIVLSWGNNDLPDTLRANDYVTTTNNKLFYRNRGNRLEQIYETSLAGTIPSWAVYMHTLSPIMSTQAATIKSLGNSVFYVSANNYITEVYWDGVSWQYAEVTSAPQVSTGLPIRNCFSTLPNDRKIFYRNISGQLQQIYWSTTSNTWISYTHTTAPLVALNSDIRATPDGRVVYKTVNGYIAILTFNPSTLVWTAQEINSIPGFHPSSNFIAINSGNQIFYRNINGKLQEVYWGNYLGTNQWIGYTTGIDYNGNKMAINSDHKMFYFSDNYELTQVYFDAATSSWIEYIHPNSKTNAATIKQLLYVDQYDKVFYANDLQPLKLKALWFDKPCITYPPCTYNSYRPSAEDTKDNDIYATPIVKNEYPVIKADLQEGGNIINAQEQANKINEPNYIVYPNPSTDGIYRIDGTLVQTRVEVQSIQGETLLVKEVTSNNNSINLAHLPNGMYMLICTNGVKKEIHKIVLNAKR